MYPSIYKEEKNVTAAEKTTGTIVGASTMETVSFSFLSSQISGSTKMR